MNRLLSRLGLAGAAVLALGLFLPATAAAYTLRVSTVPATPGVPVTLAGVTVETDEDGVAVLRHDMEEGLGQSLKVKDVEVADGVRVSFARWYGDPNRHRVAELTAALDVHYLVSWSFADIQGERVDPAEISSMKLKSSHGLGHTYSGPDLARPQWLQGSRVVSWSEGPASKDLYYTLEDVNVEGASVVNRAQQRFEPRRERSKNFELLYYSASIRSRDALFGFPIGSAVRLKFPDGHWERHELEDGELVLSSLPRGDYWVEVEAPGFSFLRPVALSRNQEVELEVMSYIDIGVIVGVLVAVAIGLLLVGRPQIARVAVSWRLRLPRPLNPRWRAARRAERPGGPSPKAAEREPAVVAARRTAAWFRANGRDVQASELEEWLEARERQRGRELEEWLETRERQRGRALLRAADAEGAPDGDDLPAVPAVPVADGEAARARDTRHRAVGRGVSTFLLVLLLGLVGVLAVAPAARSAEKPTPILAYYYIWFNATSWNRAKTDYPVLGRYSSDERRVMDQHVRWAKAAGIEGFIVSWKSTPTLDGRLEALIEVAQRRDFKLVMIYQGLDFEREPLPPRRIAYDLDHFIDRFAASEAFDMFEKPVMIWSGTWRFSNEQIEKVAGPRRDRLLILASEQSREEYESVSELVDGNAYYWSSVDPQKYPTYWKKLVEMGAAVHDDHGLWIAPSAPGFDARLVGGTSVVPRRGGATLRARMDGAVRSSPDAIGLISWNEFSENTHVEPSTNFEARYLEVLTDIAGAQPRFEGDLDSSDPGSSAPATDFRHGTPLLFGLLTLVATVALAAVWRRRRSAPTVGGTTPHEGH